MAFPVSLRVATRLGTTPPGGAGHRLPIDLSGRLAVTAPGAREPLEIRGRGAQIVIRAEAVRDLRAARRGSAGRRVAALLETFDLEAIVEVRGRRIARRRPASFLPWRVDPRGLLGLLFRGRR